MAENENKKSKINETLSIVKLGSIVLSAIVFICSILSAKGNIYNDYEAMRSFILALLFTAVLSGLYYLWSFTWQKKIAPQRQPAVQILESILFTFFFMGVVFITGKHESQYKIIFLFIIIPLTIQRGARLGVVLSTLSTLFILTVDLLFAPKTNTNVYFENDLIISAIFYLTAWLLGYYVKLENEHIEMLENKANVDGLTGLYNHRYFYDTLIEEIRQYKAGAYPVALLFMDIDYFKEYNDLYGHLNGDKVLRAVADMMRKTVKSDSILSRYGGDEFAVILKGLKSQDVYTTAENIRLAMEQMHFDGEEHLSSRRLTLSIGIAMCSKDIQSDIELIKCADDALYRAKFFKKNRVEVYTSVLDMLKIDIEQDDVELITSLKTLISVINAKDRYTYGHVERVVMYAKMLADKLGLPEQERKTLILGAYVHDIGKINISEQILNKKMPLTDEEWEILQQHPVDGLHIIEQVSVLRDVGPLVLFHHERYDGSGYPSHLKGQNIPFLARVLTVVDSFDAMTFNRPYKPAMSFSEAIKELQHFSGIQFDPELVDAFVEVLSDAQYDVEGFVPGHREKYGVRSQ